MWKVLGVFAFLIVAIMANAVFKTGKLDFSGLLPKNPAITIDDHRFLVQVAKTQQQKEIGLSEKQSIKNDEGMFFPFATADYYGFWMKNMKFPLDIIYLHNNIIVTIYHNLQNPTEKNDTWQIVKPTEPADGVLEINAGLAKQYNFKPGDTIKKENL